MGDLIDFLNIYRSQVRYRHRVAFLKGGKVGEGADCKVHWVASVVVVDAEPSDS